jgi:glycine/D-amino acid oxidase-like deaminating enzyme
MDEELKNALVAGLRAVADALEEGLESKNGQSIPPAGSSPPPGGDKNALRLLEEVMARNDQGFGVSRDEMRSIAKLSGYSMRGTAGLYFRGDLTVNKDDDSRWITESGRRRVEENRM